MSAIEYVSHLTERVECITDIGLLLVATDDAFGRLVRSVTKQDYNYIGWYYQSSVTGCQQLYYILVDPFSFTAPDWLCDSDTLESLARSPLVSRLDLRPIDPCPEMCAQALAELKLKIKLKCVEVINEYRCKYSKCLSDVVKQLFGYRITTTGAGLTSIEMVNTVLQRACLFDKVPQSDKVNPGSDYKIDGMLKSNAQGLAEFFQILGMPFQTQAVANPGVANKLLASYVEPNCVFGNKIFRVQLPCHGETEKTKAYIISRHKSSAYMGCLIKTFGDLLLADSEFFATVIAGMNDQRKTAAIREVFLADSVELLALLVRQLVKQNIGTCTGQTNDTICKINLSLQTISGLLGGCPPRVPTYPGIPMGCGVDCTTNSNIGIGSDFGIGSYLDCKSVVDTGINNVRGQAGDFDDGINNVSGQAGDFDAKSGKGRGNDYGCDIDCTFDSNIGIGSDFGIGSYLDDESDESDDDTVQQVDAPVVNHEIVPDVAPKTMLKIRVENLNDEILVKLYADIKRFGDDQKMSGVRAEVATEMARRGLRIE